MSAGWYIHQVPVGRQDRALAALREAGVEVIRLMCFRQVRAHPRVKKRRADFRQAVPALGDYVFIRAAGEEELARIAALHPAVERMPWQGRPAPRLSRRGEAWLMHPPRGLFRDTDLARFRAGAALRPHDRVAAWTPLFAGHEGEVVRISGGRARVQFDESMFEIDVPVEALVLVTEAARQS